MYRKYGMCQIVRNFYSVKTKIWYYLDFTNDGGFNRQNNETCDLQCTNNKIIMTIKIITYPISMYWSNSHVEIETIVSV